MMEKYEPMFSIIIPVYNTVMQLSRCVNSILKQDFQNYEVILVDDGSSDGSGALCDKFTYEDTRISCIHKVNGGASDARNAGVLEAKGKYIMFVDSDDMWEGSNALAELNKIIQDNPGIDLIIFGLEIRDEDGRTEKVRKPVIPEYVRSDKEAVVKSLIYSNQYFSASYVKVLRRDFFLQYELFFTRDLLSEDIEWSFRVLVRCQNIKVYSSTFYKRIRRKEGSLTAEIGKKNVIAILDSIENGIDIIKKSVSSDILKKLYFEYWAYQYAMLLGFVKRIEKDENDINLIERMRKLKWLLNYDHVGKVRAVKIICKILGVRGAISVLGMYYYLKH